MLELLPLRTRALCCSAEPASRAAKDVRDAGSLDQLVEKCKVLVCLCPPAAALPIADAQSVFASGFEGTYCDANALIPHHASKIADVVARHGSIYVDACIILLSGLRLCAALLHVAAAAFFMPRGSVIAAAGLHAGCQDAAADTFERVAHLKGAASGAVPVSAMVQSLQMNSKRA